MSDAKNHPAYAGRSPEDAGRSPDRYWLLTTTTYRTRLPGDDRGFVSPVRDDTGQEVIHNIPGTPIDARIPTLEAYARNSLKCDPVLLSRQHAEELLEQFQETAAFRGWQLLAIAIIANHVHIVVGVPGDPEPSELLGNFKSYGSRRLNQQFGKPKSGTWWTESGSRRNLPDQSAILTAIRYVMNQEFPLLIWTATIPELNLPGGRLPQASGGRKPLGHSH